MFSGSWQHSSGKSGAFVVFVGSSQQVGSRNFIFYLVMYEFVAADVVMEHDHTIDGRLVDVKRALPRDQAPGPARYIARHMTLFSICHGAICCSELL